MTPELEPVLALFGPTRATGRVKIILKKFAQFHVKSVRIPYKPHVNLTEFRHLVHGLVETSDKVLPISTEFVPHTMPPGDGARAKEQFHLAADRTQRRRLQDLQQVVIKELTAPYTVKYLLDTGQIVLTPRTRVTPAVSPEPTMEERLIMAVWCIWSLHLSRTEARYVVGSMTYGLVWDQVYAMPLQLALPESRAFAAYTGDDTAIHCAACYLPDRIGHLYKCRPPPPSDIMQPEDRRLHWLPTAVDGTSRHEASYVHCTIGGTASPNRLTGGYWGQ